ncbi:IS5/IS1182 family transposase [Gloeothece verrucosa]|uniref:Transposase IS4-like domain-containing protein n=1 Tax=Gloeothece verrucosa (strain PCC 7822) TaxID=497965 RepID=E0UNC1_GLOV7|nr:hypothetical protein Cyan7822_6790 [Gloeothece verrucosa PCC 7822]
MNLCFGKFFALFLLQLAIVLQKFPSLEPTFRSTEAIRNKLRNKKITPIIPRKSNQKRRERFNQGLYRERNRVERLINRLKQFRRIATRYEKYAHNYLAMLAHRYAGLLRRSLLYFSGYKMSLQTRPNLILRS